MSSLLEKVSATNGAKGAIDHSLPYRVEIELEGTSDIIFHAWNVEAVDEKARSAKGSKAKKTDDLESYIIRNDQEEICIPGHYLRGALVAAAKYKQDPRSPRKSLMDLAKAGIVCLTEKASLGVREWEYVRKCRVVIQRSSINRSRPAFKLGWKANFILLVVLPEYITPQILRELIDSAGKFCGLADERPTYGRFAINKFEVLHES